MDVLSDENLKFMEEKLSKRRCMTTACSDVYLSNYIMGLYSVLNKYITDNYLTYQNSINDVIFFKYNNNYYEIGKIYSPEELYYIKMKYDVEISYYIDISDVRLNNIPDKSIQIKEQIKALKETIREINDAGIPLEEIEAETNEYIRTLKHKKSNI